MANYLYNGINLPARPEWDSENYPYACISYSLTYYHLYISTVKQYMGEDGSTHWAASGTYTRYRVRPSAGETEWTLMEEESEITSTNVGSDYNIGSNVKWANFDVLNEDGTLYLAASDPIELTGGFQITYYDPTTTEFKAIGWRRQSFHTTGENAGKWTHDNFYDTPSKGWNYLKNIRSCTRDKLYYKGYEVWPDDSEYRASLGGGTMLYNGDELYLSASKPVKP